MGEAAAPYAADIARLLESSNTEPRLKRQAIQVLKGLGMAAAPHSQVIVRLVDDPDVQVRRAAVRILGGLGEKGQRHIGVITNLLMDEDSQVRMAASRSLQALGFEGSMTIEGFHGAEEAHRSQPEPRMTASKRAGPFSESILATSEEPKKPLDHHNSQKTSHRSKGGRRNKKPKPSQDDPPSSSEAAPSSQEQPHSSHQEPQKKQKKQKKRKRDKRDRSRPRSPTLSGAAAPGTTTVPPQKSPLPLERSSSLRRMRGHEARAKCTLPRLKLCILGQERAGKTSIVRRLTHGDFNEAWESTQGGAQAILEQRSWQMGSLEMGGGEAQQELYEAIARSYCLSRFKQANEAALRDGMQIGHRSPIGSAKLGPAQRSPQRSPNGNRSSFPAQPPSMQLDGGSQPYFSELVTSSDARHEPPRRRNSKSPNRAPPDSRRSSPGLLSRQDSVNSQFSLQDGGSKFGSRASSQQPSRQCSPGGTRPVAQFYHKIEVRPTPAPKYCLHTYKSPQGV